MRTKFKIPEGSLESRIRKNVMSRQKLKKKWDKHCKYGADGRDHGIGYGFTNVEHFKADDSENWVRLLDEGVVVEGDGSPYAVIAKGVLKTWYDELPADFEGYINKDHISGIGLGSYSKADLRLVPIGDDRYGIDVNVKLDHELYAVKDLLRQMDRKALSSEFYYDADEYVKASVVTGDKDYPDWWLIPKISAVAIVGYAVVDNPKNANSYAPNLLEKASDEGEERNSMTLEELKKLAAAGDVKAAEELKKLEAENGDQDADDADKGDESDEGDKEADDLVNGAKTNANAEGDEGDGDEGTEDKGDTDKEGDTEDKGDEGDKEGDGKESEEDKFSAEAILAEVKTLKEGYAALEAENKELKAKLAAYSTEKADLNTRLVEVLGLASTAKKSDEEGGSTPKKESDEDDYTAALKDTLKGI